MDADTGAGADAAVRPAHPAPARERARTAREDANVRAVMSAVSGGTERRGIDDGALLGLLVVERVGHVGGRRVAIDRVALGAIALVPLARDLAGQVAVAESEGERDRQGDGAEEDGERRRHEL